MSKCNPTVVVKRRRSRAPRSALSPSKALGSLPTVGSPSNIQSPPTRRVLHLSGISSRDGTTHFLWPDARVQASDEA
jgi:hypothetical protein